MKINEYFYHHCNFSIHFLREHPIFAHYSKGTFKYIVGETKVLHSLLQVFCGKLILRED